MDYKCKSDQSRRIPQQHAIIWLTNKDIHCELLPEVNCVKVNKRFGLLLVLLLLSGITSSPT